MAQEKERAGWQQQVRAKVLRAGIDKDLENYKINTDYLEKKTEQLAKMKSDLEGMTGDAHKTQMEDIVACNADIESIDQRNKSLMDGVKDAKGTWIAPSVSLRRQGITLMENEAKFILEEAKQIRKI